MKSCFSVFLARLMVASTLIAAGIMTAGLLWYLSAHLTAMPGDHIFQGEPGYLKDPVQMFHHIFENDVNGHRRSLMMLGVFLLLISPLIRVLFAGMGYLLERNWLYTLISGVVFFVLLVSLFFGF